MRIAYSLNQIHLSFAVMSEQHIIGVHTKDRRSNYCDWISAWTSHLQNQSVIVKVPETIITVSHRTFVRLIKQSGSPLSHLVGH